MVREDGERVGADLVRGVAIGGDAIGARHDQVHLPSAHQRRRHHVSDEAVRDSVAHALPRRQPRALHHRPGLVHPHQRDLALRVRRANDPERGAVAGGRQRARIAVGQDPRPGRHQRCAVIAHRPVGGDVFVEDRLSFGEEARADRVDRHRPTCQQCGAHPVERPEQVHGRRPRRRQSLDRRLDVGEQAVERRRPALTGSQSHAEGRRDTDGWRTSHDEGAKGLGDVLPARELTRQLLARQSSLVEQ